MRQSYPDPTTALRELRAREPLFHRPEFGTTRAAFEAIMAKDFWEIGASGKKYVKTFILDTLEERHRYPVTEKLEISDFECRELAPGVFLVTYLLDQAGRLSRRSTIWRWSDGRWRTVYHQGTLITG